MNHYERKQADRKQFYLERAAQADRQADLFSEQSSANLAGIPLGQPILRGHHSEQKHRAAVERSHSNMAKAVKAGKTAAYYRDKAASVGKAGISSDDPEALQKLQAKLQKLQNHQEEMKQINKASRAKDRDKLAELGLKEATIQKMEAEGVLGQTVFPSYQVQNNSAEIRRLKQRIETLQATHAREDQEQQYDGLKLVEDTDANRVQLYFEDKPSKETCKDLRAHGFRFSRTNSCWQRMLTANGVAVARRFAAGYRTA